MPGPKWTDVKLPAGAILNNWPLLLGGGLSVVILFGIFVTGDEDLIREDTLARIERENTLTTAQPAPSPGELAAPVERAARRAAADQARRERDSEQEVRREAALAEARERRQTAELRAAREQLERYRARQAAGQDVGFERLATGNAEVASLREALALEQLERENQALRAPLVVSSARQFSGGRTHAILQYPPQQVSVAQASAPSLPQTFQAPPPMPVPAPSAVQPGSGGTGFPVTPRGPAVVGGPVGGGLGPPVGVPGRGDPGTFTLGPTADGGGADPSLVVVTPNDGIDYRVYEGTLIPAVLQTQIHGDFTGPVSAQVTRPVYARNRRRILIPRGTVVLGTASGAEGPFQERLAVGFHRMIFPDGRWVTLEGSDSLWGLSAMGESSIKDLVDRHYFEAFAGAGAVGLLAGLTQGGGGGGQGGYGVQTVMSQNAAQVALQLMSRFLNRRPTIIIRAGHRLNVRMMTDILIPSEVSTDLD